MIRALLAAALLAGCSRAPRVTEGSTVGLDYELSSAGVVQESSAQGDPLVVVQGSGDLPNKVDQALLGLRVGDALDLELSPEQGFGWIDPGLVRSIPLAKFGKLAKGLKPGMMVAGARGGLAEKGKVLKISKGVATLDFNHPLAGKALRYKLRVVSIRPR